MRVLIVGAGGQGRVVADALLQAQRQGLSIGIVGFVDADTTLHGRAWLNVPVLGGLDVLGATPHDAVVVAIGDNATRHRVALSSDVRGRPLAVVRHPQSIIAPDVPIDAGSMISAGAIVVTGARIGRGCIVNTGCVIDHDCVIGDWAHVAPRAVLGGDVTIGERAFVGIGATVMPGRRVGDHAIVGAGAVVTTDVPEGAVVVGIPARARVGRAER